MMGRSNPLLFDPILSINGTADNMANLSCTRDRYFKIAGEFETREVAESDIWDSQSITLNSNTCPAIQRT